METVVELAMLLTLCAVASAAFAADRGCSPLRWFLLGLVLGPVAVALVLARRQAGETGPPPPAATSAPRSAPLVKGQLHKAVRALLPALRLLLLLAIVGVGVLEARERWRAHNQAAALEAWERLGDGYLRAAKAGVTFGQTRQAQQAVGLYAVRLRVESEEVERQLALATSGLRESYGAEAVLRGALRLPTLQAPRYPAYNRLSPEDQVSRVAALTDLLTRYRQHLAAVDSVAR